MLKDAQGNLKIYSIGIVVKDKERNSDTIEVYPVEELPLAQGDLKETTQYDQTMPDSKNVPIQGKVEGKNYLTAKWIPFGHSNRITPPDVYANEHVILFRFADNEEYYWTTIYREPMFRRLETVCYMFSNLKEKMQEFTKESSYWCEVSTHDKKIQIHTSNSNGERYEYDIIINTEESTIIVKDNVDNFIHLVSPENKIHVRTNHLICLDAPVIRMGVNCDSSNTDYHDHAFIRTDDDLEHARIGNAWQSYTHYDQNTVFTHADQSITEETNTKSVKVASDMDVQTGSYSHVSDGDVNIQSGTNIDLKAGRVNVDNLHINGVAIHDYIRGYFGG